MFSLEKKSSIYSLKRADTYEGPQMSFQFPLMATPMSPLPQDSSPVLSGPAVEPYYMRQSSPIASTITEEYVTCSEASYGDENSDVPTVPTKSNISFPITENTPPAAVPSHSDELGHPQAYSSLLEPINVHDYSQYAHYNETKPLSTPSSRYKARLSRNLSTARAMRRPIKRSNSVRTSDHISLFSTTTSTSLKRSHAIRYKVGWLTNMKETNKRLFNFLRKSWRRIKVHSNKALLKFRSRFNKTKTVDKASISLPVERTQGKSINEIKRDMSHWYVPENTSKVPPVPVMKNTPPSKTGAEYPTKQRICSLMSIQSSIDKIATAPLNIPRNRITSSPLIQRYIRQEELKKRLSSAPMTLTEHHYKHPSSVSDRSSNILMKDDQILVTESFKVFFRNVIAQRISKKLGHNRNRVSLQISLPDLEEDNESEISSVISRHSDYETQFTFSDYENDDDDDEDDVCEVIISPMINQEDPTTVESDSSTNFYSASCQEDEILNDTLVKYQQTYITGSLKRNSTNKITRSSTLPCGMKVKEYLQNGEIRIKRDILAESRRYLPVVSSQNRTFYGV